MGEAAEHVFQSQYAAPALIQAMESLSKVSGKSLEELEGISMGDAYELAVTCYDTELPTFWKVWNSWNTMSDEPAPMGDL